MAVQRAQSIAEHPDPQAVEHLGPARVSDRPLQFELIPQVCLVADVCHFLRISESSFHRLMKAGELALVELRPLDSTRRFTGASVAFEIKRRASRKVN